MDDWPEIVAAFKYEYAEDNHFAELRNTEILRDRVSMLRDVVDYAGRYYSNEWIRRNVLYQTEEDMEEIDKQIKEEQDNPQYQTIDAAAQDGMPPMAADQQQIPQDQAPAPKAKPDMSMGPKVPDVVKK